MIQPRTSAAVAEELSTAGWTLLPDGVWRAPGADNQHCWAVALELCRAGESHMPLIVLVEHKPRTIPKKPGLGHGGMFKRKTAHSRGVQRPDTLAAKRRPRTSDERIALVRQLRAEGLTFRAIGERMGTTDTNVFHIHKTYCR